MELRAMVRARIAIQAPDFVGALRWRQIAEKRLAEEHAERDRLEERARQSASRFHASAAEAAEHARAEAEERARAKDEAAEAAARRGEIREELYGAARRERVGYASTLASQFATGTEMGQPVSPGSAAGSAAEGGSSSSEDERDRGFERTVSTEPPRQPAPVSVVC
jgi:hypothetical protein